MKFEETAIVEAVASKLGLDLSKWTLVDEHHGDTTQVVELYYHLKSGDEAVFYVELYKGQLERAEVTTR